MPSTFHITVFGGSQLNPDDAAYAQAYRLGQMLGESGWAVLTGGYIGSMEAVSRGAAEAGGHVIGVTSDEIEAWRPLDPNPWVKEERRFPTARQRLYALISDCDGALALPGGIGTLAEIAVMYSQLQIRSTPPKPLIAIGTGWLAVFKQFYELLGTYVPTGDQHWLTFAPNVERGFDQLKTALTGSSS